MTKLDPQTNVAPSDLEKSSQPAESKPAIESKPAEPKPAIESKPAPTPSRDPYLRAPNEDDDGYDPYSDRRYEPPLFERDPWY